MYLNLMQKDPEAASEIIQKTVQSDAVYYEEISTTDGCQDEYYNYFYERNISVDMIPVDADFSQYKMVVAPVLYMVKPGMKEALEEYVKNYCWFSLPRRLSL